ncbi:MAG: hypothetical protein IPK04_22875 [Bdellovibrionales bacterium]|nr:hypothetical protein [Bdellovibrionales bacterium]
MAAAAAAPTLNSAAGVTPETLSKFVHDLNNILAIVDMSMDRLTKNLTEIKATRELENVAKIDGHVKRIINLVKDFREAKNKAS